MSSRFSLQSPYTLASLPRPIDQTNGRYVVGEVFGGEPGPKKRRKLELAVGVDGEGVNLYDISASRLITSYALPPQTSFTCPPTSLRTKTSKTTVQRRTYVSTKGPEPRITLFSETVEGSSSTSPLSTERTTDLKATPVFLGTIKAARGIDVAEESWDLLAVFENGEIRCFDGENLQEKWTSPSSALLRESTSSSADITVEFVHPTDAYAASQGILKSRQDALAIFPQEISESGFNPVILFIITKFADLRTIHAVSLPRRSSSQPVGLRHSVDSLLSINISSAKGQGLLNNATFSLKASAGILQQLCDGKLTTFDLNGTIPKETSQIRSKHGNSFLRLSSTATIVSSDSTLNVYNPKYQSILASTTLEGQSNLESLKRKRGEDDKVNGTRGHVCTLVSYFPKLGTAIGILDNNLIGIQTQVEGGSPAGRLIDSIGCAITTPKYSRRPDQTRKIAMTTMRSYLPCSQFDGSTPWAEQIKPLEDAHMNCDISSFDSLMTKIFAPKSVATKPLVNGDSVAAQASSSKIPEDVDRRWIIYALNKIFSWHRDEETNAYKLTVAFYPPDTLALLLGSGYVTVSSIESALRTSTRQSPIDELPAGQLVHAMVESDEEMYLLYGLVAANYLGAPELVCAIRHLMRSMSLEGEDLQESQRLLTNGEDTLVNGDLENEIENQEAAAEADLILAEYQLGPEAGIRAEALSVALSKLYTCPNRSIVRALQGCLSTQEVVSLIHILRYELARGAWTTRYLDAEFSEVIDEEGDIQDNAIVLIASLLNSCIDAVGAGGWLSGDARLVNGDPFEAEELITSLKLEVSAALEGVQEAVYLKGLTAEMIRYGDRLEGGMSASSQQILSKILRRGRNPSVETTLAKPTPLVKPMLLASGEQDTKSLPLGLKADHQISLLKVGAGGEINIRTRRDIGHLKSQKVGKYSLERIMI